MPITTIRWRPRSPDWTISASTICANYGAGSWERYRAHHGASLLRRRLAYELQARAHGDLPAEARRRLKRLHQAFKADPAYTPLPGLGLKPGTVLTRTWRGVMHHVDVMDEGFEYRGERFGSLSEIARRITGTRWSGPLFFGLKDVAERNP